MELTQSAGDEDIGTGQGQLGQQLEGNQTSVLTASLLAHCLVGWRVPSLSPMCSGGRATRAHGHVLQPALSQDALEVLRSRPREKEESPHVPVHQGLLSTPRISDLSHPATASRVVTVQRTLKAGRAQRDPISCHCTDSETRLRSQDESVLETGPELSPHRVSCDQTLPAVSEVGTLLCTTDHGVASFRDKAAAPSKQAVAPQAPPLHIQCVDDHRPLVADGQTGLTNRMHISSGKSCRGQAEGPTLTRATHECRFCLRTPPAYHSAPSSSKKLLSLEAGELCAWLAARTPGPATAAGRVSGDWAEGRWASPASHLSGLCSRFEDDITEGASGKILLGQPPGEASWQDQGVWALEPACPSVTPCSDTSSCGTVCATCLIRPLILRPAIHGWCFEKVRAQQIKRQLLESTVPSLFVVSLSVDPNLLFLLVCSLLSPGNRAMPHTAEPHVSASCADEAVCQRHAEITRAGLWELLAPYVPFPTLFFLQEGRGQPSWAVKGTGRGRRAEQKGGQSRKVEGCDGMLRPGESAPLFHLSRRFSGHCYQELILISHQQNQQSPLVLFPKSQPRWATTRLCPCVPSLPFVYVRVHMCSYSVFGMRRFCFLSLAPLPA
ncbi:hypothetical protein Cadr_000015929 [Camelus dromedarius]|uniref:Uncharacterized protein n=1 Tax=Camelus dromedarius TaxID=9838 RepID=A0A5N4E9T4_CAMDR|nr:hypothetical protein Cadr_000015929 [Camelus dromedarius]